jgi:broad specificity phosphatase PhoE
VILFVRHGETDANRRRLALGRADPELTERGVAQAAALAARFTGQAIGAVRSSPLRRARDTAAPIAVALGLDVVVDDRLVELDYGAWDTTSFADLPVDDLARWRNDPTFAPPGGESLRAVTSRVADFCVEELDGPHVIAVSHVSPIKAAVTWALGAGEELGWRMFLELASVTRVGAGRDGVASLLGFNDVSHLEKLDAG